MSSIVSDAGPLIHLAQIDKLHLLRILFESILIVSDVKKEVVDEGLRLGYPDAKVIHLAIEAGWIQIRSLSKTKEQIAQKLAKGENLSLTDTKTLVMARQQGDRIIVDEKALSDLARMYKLKVWNTWTILLEALSRGLISSSDIESAITELGTKRHKLTMQQTQKIREAAKSIVSACHGRKNED